MIQQRSNKTMHEDLQQGVANAAAIGIECIGYNWHI
jgi:hypothetical protein